MNITPEPPVLTWEDLRPVHWELLDRMWLIGRQPLEEFVDTGNYTSPFGFRNRVEHLLTQLIYVDLARKVQENPPQFEMTADGRAVAHFRFSQERVRLRERYQERITTPR